MGHSLMQGGVIRRLWKPDKAAFRDHLLRLDAESRNDRFAMSVSDEFLRHYAENCFGLDDTVYGYFVEGDIRGAGELRRVGAPDARSGLSPVAEAAFSVERDWRHRGVGAELMARIVRAARNRRTQTLYMSCLARNRAMQALARKFEAEMRFEPMDVTGEIAPKGPTAFSLLYEAMDDATGFATAMLDLQRRAFGLDASDKRS